jgi:hypothetical protein
MGMGCVVSLGRSKTPSGTGIVSAIATLSFHNSTFLVGSIVVLNSSYLYFVLFYAKEGNRLKKFRKNI